MHKYTLQTSKSFAKESTYLKELNPEQLEAVTAPDGPCMVIAGAGSGKTRVVTSRVAYLVESGVPAENILLVTFTQKAAREMLYRAGGLIHGDISKLKGGTFHHICNLILRKHAKKIGFDSSFTILDREDSKDMLNMCRKDATTNKKGKLFPKSSVLQNILGLSVNTREHILNVIEKRYPHLEEFADDIQKVLNSYAKKKKETNAMDFDDLLEKTLDLLSENDNVKEAYARYFKYILVDEYQDTNLLQTELLDLWASHWRNIMVVGDDFQSIYSFRGARFENILEFPGKYPDAKIFTVETNYRSTPQILNFANYIISSSRHKFKKGLNPVRKPGAKPIVISTMDVYQQASFIAQRIYELYEEGLSLSDIAVLYRAHFHSMELQMELSRKGIPFWVRSGLRFFEQAHIKDVLSYMRILENAKDELPWMRLLRHIPQIGDATASKIYEKVTKSAKPFDLKPKELGLPKFAEQNFNRFITLLRELNNEKTEISPAAMVQRILKEDYHSYIEASYIDWERRIEDIQQLARFAETYSSAENFISELALVGGIRTEDMVDLGEEEDKVILSTVHQAKGLEWKAVFIIWMVEGYFPSYKADTQEEREEEQRLFYVSLTRAKDQLYLTYPLISMKNNSPWTSNSPSSFLGEIDEDAFEEWDIK